MKSHKILAAGAVFAMSAALVAGAVAYNSAGSFKAMSAEDCAHEHVEHYAAVTPTTDHAGRPEHWACCDCHRAWYDEARTDEIIGRASDYAVADWAQSTAATQIDVEEVGISDITKIYTSSDKVKGLDQTDWDNASYGKAGGTINYYNVDGYRAMYVSALNVTDEARTAMEDASNGTAGYSEWRYEKSVTGCKSVTFDYKYWDTNRDVYAADGTSHQYVQFKDTAGVYHTHALDLINDNQWHTATVTVPNDGSYDITYLLIEIYHFHGEMYVSNMVIGDTLTTDYTTSRYGAWWSVGNAAKFGDWSNNESYNGTSLYNNWLRYLAWDDNYTGVASTLNLPVVDYTKIPGGQAFYYYEGGGFVTLGFDADNCYSYDNYGTDGTKGYITVRNISDESITVRITSTSGGVYFEKVITDQDMIHGRAPLALYAVKNYNYSRGVYIYNLNEVPANKTAPEYTDFASNSYGMTCGSLTGNRWGHFGSTANYYSNDTQSQFTMELSRIDYTNFSQFQFQGFNSTGVGIGFSVDDYYIVESGGADTYYTLVTMSNISDSSMDVTIKHYSGLSDSSKNANSADAYQYMDADHLVATETCTVTNWDVIHGIKGLGLYYYQMYAFGRGWGVAPIGGTAKA